MTIRAPAEEHVDVLVLGAGAAGLACALAASGARVLVVSAQPAGVGGSTPLAQGGIAAAVGVDDHPRLHEADTVAAGAGLVDARAARCLSEAGPAVIDRLLALGVDFDRDGNGRLALALEAAHGRRRVVHAGDETGAALMRALVSAAAQDRRVTLRTARVEALARARERIAGALLVEDGRERVVTAGAVVLATGGLGALYPATTNASGARGEGLVYAAEHGAALADLELVQFHPTALDVPAARRPLLSEALRGAGARVCDEDGRPFLAEHHPLADLAPRDVVVRAIFRRAARGQRIYLDVREIMKSGRGASFPAMQAAARAFALDPARDLLPVAPAAHYHMGGVVTDLTGRTSLPGLWACGEVACTGVHGANRLASNSLLEAVAFGERVARDVAHGLASAAPGDVELPARVRQLAHGPHDEEVERTLQRLMGDDVGVVRDGPTLARARGVFLEAARCPSLSARSRAHALACFLVAAAALERRESRGAHFRVDFPDAVDALATRATTTMDTLVSASHDDGPSLSRRPRRLASR